MNSKHPPTPRRPNQPVMISLGRMEVWSVGNHEIDSQLLSAVLVGGGR